MHAAIKIISFLVFGAAVSTGNNQVILAGLILVAPLYVITGISQLRAALRMLKRLKWLFVSILVVYLFFTPGQLLLPGVLWGPTVEGMMQGVSRVFVLMLLVAAVNLLITSTVQEEFLSAILWCLHPLSLFGISHERLAVRITLTLDAVSQARNEVTEKQTSGSNDKGKPKLLTISRTASQLFATAISTAESATLREITLPGESRPPVYQWLIPLTLVAMFSLIQYLSVGGFF